MMLYAAASWLSQARCGGKGYVGPGFPDITVNRIRPARALDHRAVMAFTVGFATAILVPISFYLLCLILK